MVAHDDSPTSLWTQGQQEGGEDMPPQRFDDSAPAQAPKLSLEEELKSLRAELEKTTQAYNEANDKAQKNWDLLLRKEADLQNIQRRSQTQVDNAKKFALERFASELLQVVDSIEQGLAQCNNDNVTVKDVLEGMSLTRKVVLDVMEKEGISQINPESQPFNPNFHEAISMIETDDCPPNQVVSVFQPGYILNERLLRPARVVVSRAITPKDEADNTKK